MKNSDIDLHVLEELRSLIEEKGYLIFFFFFSDKFPVKIKESDKGAVIREVWRGLLPVSETTVHAQQECN